MAAMEDTVGRVTLGKIIAAVAAFVIVLGIAYGTQWVDFSPMLK